MKCGRRYRQVAAGLAALALIATAPACGSSSAGDSLQRGRGHGHAHPAARKQTGHVAGFPVRLSTPRGTVVIPKRPRRIISLDPTATETLFALGAGKQVVAVDTDSDYPKDAPRTKLSGLNPNVEAIAAYKPQLVVVPYLTPNFAQQMAQVHIPVLYQPAPANLNGAYGEIRQLGRAIGRRRVAQRMVSSMRRRIDGIIASVRPKSPRLTYYFELDQTHFTLTSATFVGSILSKMGLSNIADKAGAHASGGYPQLSSESIVAASPDIVFLADTVCCGQSFSTVKKRPGWSTITAVKDHEVVSLNDDIASRWGPRVVDLVRDVAKAVERARRAGLH